MGEGPQEAEVAPEKPGCPPAQDSTRLRQAYLDLGQSNFGPCKCPTCGLLYTIGEPTDEKVHRDYHRTFLKKTTSPAAAAAAAMKFINRPPRATFASILRVLGSSDLPLLFFFFSLSERASALLTIIIIIVKLGLQK